MMDQQLSPSSYAEKHTLHGSSNPVRFSVGKDVLLRVENDEVPKDRGSQRVVVKNLAQFKGKNPSYGRIVDAHHDLTAYRFSNEATGEAVRVLSADGTNRVRILIKDFKFTVADVQWSNIAKTLAVTDVQGNLYIYEFDDECLEKGIAKKQISIIRCHKKGEAKSNLSPRISWCPYVRAENGDLGDDKLIVSLSVENVVDLFDVGLIRKSSKEEKICFDLENFSGKQAEGHTRLEVQKPVLSVRISPDGTAVAVATEDLLNFYVPVSGDAYEFKLAQDWSPAGNNKIHDFFFLDDITSPRQGIDGNTFWKHCVVFFDNGRLVNILDEAWSVIGRLKINEITQGDSPMTVSLDPTARFVFVSDFDEGMTYCIEVGVSENAMRFLSVTQITFSPNVVYTYMVPFTTSVAAKPIKRSQGSDESNNGSETTVDVAQVIFTALAASCVATLHVELDLTPTVSVERLETPGIEDEEENEDAEKEIEELEKSVDLQNLSDHDDGQGSSGIYGRAKSAPENKDEKQSDGEYDSYAETSGDESPSVGSAHENGYDAKDIADLTNQIAELTETVGELTVRIEGMEGSRAALVEGLRSEMCTVLESISDELATRDENMLTKMSELMTSQREMIEGSISAVVQSQVETSGVEEELKELCRKAVTDSLQNTLIPLVEKVCSNLFAELNARFCEGLQEYVDQLKGSMHVHSARLASTPDELAIESLIQIIESGNIERAFQVAIDSGDLSMIMVVCNKVDPDQFFDKDESPLPLNYVLLLLSLLSSKLDTDTELKLKYIDYATMLVNSNEKSFSPESRGDLEKVNEWLAAFTNNESNKPIYRRQTRLLQQLISSKLLK